MGRLLSLTIVWLALLALLALTIVASFVLTGPFSLVAGLSIAAVKVVLIYWFFMHLREEDGLTRLMAIAVLAWLAILLLLTVADYATRA